MKANRKSELLQSIDSEKDANIGFEDPPANEGPSEWGGGTQSMKRLDETQRMDESVSLIDALAYKTSILELANFCCICVESAANEGIKARRKLGK
jgi:hypothetical protein